MNEFINTVKQVLFLRDKIINQFQALKQKDKDVVLAAIELSKEDWEALSNQEKALLLRKNAFKIEEEYSKSDTSK